MGNKLTLEVEVRVRQEGNYPGFQLSERLDMDAASFSELAEILRRFDDLFRVVKREREKLAR